jgi:protein-S-isoprenylcysteine O-methyltransferase Ste14
MYVAVLAIVIGQSLVLGNRVLLLYAAVVWLLFHMFVTLYEEPKLGAQFGESYQRYRRTVRRWLPRVSAARL